MLLLLCPPQPLVELCSATSTQSLLTLLLSPHNRVGGQWMDSRPAALGR
jgi:hypothetical protein